LRATRVVLESPEVNQFFSERRTATVRDFLIAQAVPVNNVIAQRFGTKNPMAFNTTAAGAADKSLN